MMSQEGMYILTNINIQQTDKHQSFRTLHHKKRHVMAFFQPRGIPYYETISIETDKISPVGENPILLILEGF